MYIHNGLLLCENAPRSHRRVFCHRGEGRHARCVTPRAPQPASSSSSPSAISVSSSGAVVAFAFFFALFFEPEAAPAASISVSFSCSRTCSRALRSVCRSARLWLFPVLPDGEPAPPPLALLRLAHQLRASACRLRASHTTSAAEVPDER